MLIVNAGGSPKRSERQLRDACKHLPGVLILNAIVEGQGGRTREIDGVLLTTAGTFTVEVKGTQLTGAVHTDANRPWRIGTKAADFYGGANPLRQARTAAQALAGALRTAGVDAGFVTSIVAIAGDNLTLPPARVGDTWTVLVGDLPAALHDARARAMTSETVAGVCAALGVDVRPEALEAEGFTSAGSRANRHNRNTQLRTRATDALTDAFAALPGLILFPGEKGSSGPDQHAVLLTPTGVFAVKAKATTLRGPLDCTGEAWSIGGTEAHFGKGRPEAQARTMVSWLRKALAGAGVNVKVTGVVTLAGVGIEVQPHKSHGAWVCLAEDLAGVLLRNVGRVTLAEAAAVCALLNHPASEADLLAAGFTPAGPDTAAADRAETARVSATRQAHRDERLARARTQAHGDWRSQNTRRVLGSAVALVLLLGAAPVLPPVGYLPGLLLAAGSAAWQLTQRRRLPGPRDRGAGAVLLWLVTLAPVCGVGVMASTLATLPAVAPQARALVALLALMSTILMGALLLLGRSAFIYAPAVIWERHDQQGRPTGTYAAVSARSGWGVPGRARLDGDWRPLP